MIRGTLSRSRLRPISLDRLLGQPTAHALNNPVNYEVWDVIQQRRQDLWRSPPETTRPVSDLGKFFRLGSEHNGSELFQFEVHSNQTIRFRPIRLIEVYMYMQSVVGMRIHNTRASKINNRNPKSKRTTYSMLLIRQKLKYNYSKGISRPLYDIIFILRPLCALNLILYFIMYDKHITHQVSQVTGFPTSWRLWKFKKFTTIIFAFRLDPPQNFLGSVCQICGSGSDLLQFSFCGPVVTVYGHRNNILLN